MFVSSSANGVPPHGVADELFNIAELADYAMSLGARANDSLAHEWFARPFMCKGIICPQGNHLPGGVRLCHDTITLQFSAPDAAGSAAATTVPTQVANYVASQTPFYPMKVHCVADALPRRNTPTGRSPIRRFDCRLIAPPRCPCLPDSCTKSFPKGTLSASSGHRAGRMKQALSTAADSKHGRRSADREHHGTRRMRSAQ